MLDVKILSEEEKLTEDGLIVELREAQDAIIETGDDFGFPVNEEMTRENMEAVTNERVYDISCSVQNAYYEHIVYLLY